MTSPGDWIEWKGAGVRDSGRKDGRVPDGTGLSSPTEPASGLGPSGFDPSRVYAVADEVQVNYLTAGRLYPLLSDGEIGFEITDDEGGRAYCLWRSCAHLDGLDWRRVGPSRDSDGSPKGGDAEGGSVACDDSAGPKDIAQ